MAESAQTINGETTVRQRYYLSSLPAVDLSGLNPLQVRSNESLGVYRTFDIHDLRIAWVKIMDDS